MSQLIYCPIDPNHGLLLNLKSGMYYCPHSEHDNYVDGKRTKPFFNPDNVSTSLKPAPKSPTPARVRRDPVPVTEAHPPVPEAQPEGDTLRTCAVCSATYAPGQYSKHKLLESHQKMLVVQKK